MSPTVAGELHAALKGLGAINAHKHMCWCDPVINSEKNSMHSELCRHARRAVAKYEKGGHKQTGLTENRVNRLVDMVFEHIRKRWYGVPAGDVDFLEGKARRWVDSRK